MHEAKLAKMEGEMKMVFQQKVQEKESKLKQSEEELYARHKEMKEALEKQRSDLEEKKRRIESGRPLTPEKNAVSPFEYVWLRVVSDGLMYRPRIAVSFGRDLPVRYMSRLYVIISAVVAMDLLIFVRIDPS